MPRVQVPVTQLGYVKAALTTALAGAQNDLTFTAKNAGPGGNEITVQYAVAGASTPLSIVVTGKAIVVNVATDGASAAISTAAQILAEINANSRANLLVTSALAPSNDGTGVVTALTATALAGGALGPAQPAETNSDAPNDHYLTGNEGNVYLEVRNANASPQTVEFELSPAYAAQLAVAGGKQTETIANGTTRTLGPFPTSYFNQNEAGDLYFNPSVTTDLKFRAYKAARS